MPRPITFSRHFPAYHPKAGQPTYFVEKIWKGMWDANKGSNNPLYPEWLQYDEAFPITDDVNESIHVHSPKLHTIRAGSRWKEGDWFKPVVWGNDVNPKSGRTGPYHSKQIQFAPEMQLKKVWDFRIKIIKGGHGFMPYIGNEPLNQDQIEEISKNDGLTKHDFSEWMVPRGKKFIVGVPVFEGQILCWDENVQY